MNGGHRGRITLTIIPDHRKKIPELTAILGVEIWVHILPVTE